MTNFSKGRLVIRTLKRSDTDEFVSSGVSMATIERRNERCKRSRWRVFQSELVFIFTFALIKKLDCTLSSAEEEKEESAKVVSVLDISTTVWKIFTVTEFASHHSDVLSYWLERFAVITWFFHVMLLLKLNSSHFKSAVSEIGESQRCVDIIMENFVPIWLAASLIGLKTAYDSVNEPNSYS